MRNGLLIAVVFFLAPGLAVFAGEDSGVMEKLAALEGDWVLLDEDGRETDVVGSSFRLTAGGSALVETMFPGSPDGHEMVNMYHADGDRVLMTHYCAAGNQPRLVVNATDDENRLELRFESITNLASPESKYMSQADYVFHGDDRLTTRWRSMTDGKLTEETTTMELKRRK
ncbi:MAG: hypothetical protein F4X98_06745 [Gammaproteobacteria bacterium]|nr:hypothetical protein [Gammaproteobacteria bacterium]